MKQPDGSYAISSTRCSSLRKGIPPCLPPAPSKRRWVVYYVAANTPENETPEQFWSRTGKAYSDVIDQFVNKKGALDSDLAHTVSARWDLPEVKLRKIYARVQKIRGAPGGRGEIGSGTKTGNSSSPHNNVEDVLKHGYATGRRLRIYTSRGVGTRRRIFSQRGFRCES